MSGLERLLSAGLPADSNAEGTEMLHKIPFFSLPFCLFME